MIKFIGFWSQPNDPDEYERHYAEVHMPLAAAVPGVADIVLTRAAQGLGGEPPSFYRAVEMAFQSEQDLERAMTSEEWQAVMVDAGGMMERFGVTVSGAIGESEDYRTA
jgi:uncharacterized protein (TIGR02118 family)